ncbi:alpha/beta hydrolase [candidate division KSB1 bacterium]|nr:alpha/beta hydrolase [candidate division KSB1 bacterium]
MKTLTFLFIINIMLSLNLTAQEKLEIPLWPNGAPTNPGETVDAIPTLTLYIAPVDKATDTAILICPGGGYQHLAIDHEGHQIAQWLNSLGISAFILKYRIGTWEGKKNNHPIPLLDAQRGIRTLRARANEWKINPERIGILGFSAGGHLASTVGTHFDSGKPDSPDKIEHVSSHPNFMILIYPVISFKTKYVHRGSRKVLLGENADMTLVENLSNETQVTSMTPPTFLIHTSEDTSVPAENSILFYLALHEAHVPVEMHIYGRGKHGFGLAPNDPVLSTWPDHCKRWLQVQGFLPK